LVSFCEEILKLFDKYNIDSMSDTSKFYWEESYNLYGIMTDAKLKVK
jgi:hypothetical protein